MTPPISYLELVQKTGIDFHLPEDLTESAPKIAGKAPLNPKPKIGGWYPVFFDQYSAAKVDEIITKMKAGKVSSVQIQYDRNTDLAKQIAGQIQSQTDMPVGLTQSSPPESSTVSYERNRVVAIIHSK